MNCNKASFRDRSQLARSQNPTFYPPSFYLSPDCASVAAPYFKVSLSCHTIRNGAKQPAEVGDLGDDDSSALWV